VAYGYNNRDFKNVKGLEGCLLIIIVWVVCISAAVLVAIFPPLAILIVIGFLIAAFVRGKF